MRMKIGDYEFEGTPTELAEMKWSLDQTAIQSQTSPQSGRPKGGRAPISEEVALDALTRRPLATSYLAIIKTLYDADRHWTKATDLQKKLKYSKSEFAGLMGAFGRRLAYSEGYQVGDFFFENEWDDELGCNRYRLPQSVRFAVAKAGLV